MTHEQLVLELTNVLLPVEGKPGEETAVNLMLLSLTVPLIVVDITKPNVGQYWLYLVCYGGFTLVLLFIQISYLLRVKKRWNSSAVRAQCSAMDIIKVWANMEELNWDYIDLKVNQELIKRSPRYASDKQRAAYRIASSLATCGINRETMRNATGSKKPIRGCNPNKIVSLTIGRTSIEVFAKHS